MNDLMKQTPCYRCHKPYNGYEYGLKIIRYGYSGGGINLCKDCFTTFKNWLDGEKKGINE